MTLLLLLLLAPIDRGRIDVESDAPETIHVALLFSAGVPPLSKTVVAGEIACQFAEAGIPTQVHAHVNPGEVRIRGRAILVRMRGWCHDQSGYSSSRAVGSLGWTHVTDGEILPMVEIDCERVRAGARGGGYGRDLSLRSLLFARALGRVIAHEMYHVLAATVEHAKSGLAKPALSGEDLVDGTLRFDTESIRRLRAKTPRVQRGLAGELPRDASPPE